MVSRKLFSMGLCLTIAATIFLGDFCVASNTEVKASTLTTSITTLLKVGSQGSDVQKLQQNLTSLGYDTKGTDGIFGQNTYNAVIAFQKDFALTVDGIVGPYTNSKINEALTTADSILRLGSSGSAVSKLQQDLTSLGYDTKGVDGVFGQNTYNAVIAFQKAYGLTIDGIVGAKTKLKIDEALANKSNILKVGSQGDAVAKLQQELTSLGYDTKGTDGIFGQNTYNAVLAFQQSRGITADGIVGPDTRSNLDEALTNRNSVLKVGSTGEAVKTLQKDLTALGFDTIGADGIFGQNTYSAVIAFQKENGLTADGVVGTETRGRIDDALYNLNTNASDILKIGSSGDAVRQLQQNLNSLGYSTGGVDGIFGQNTYNAVVAFQRANGIVADGIVGVQTKNAISIALQNGQKPPTTPSGTLNITMNLVNFVASYEGFSATPYRGADYQNQTIGYGHVIRPGENLTYLTQQQAKDLLYKDLQSFVSSVNKITAGLALSQQQFDALVSFSYNCGSGALATSTLLKDIKAGASSSTLKTDFLMWSKCNGVVLTGLKNRRTDEWELYTYGDYVRSY